jgi:hypothetical protein
VDDPQPQKIPLIFYRTAAGSEPVREWLKGLDEAERQAIGKACCGRNGGGRRECRCSARWETACGRSALAFRRKRTARVLLCLYREYLVALHGFIKKTRSTPDEDLATARKRQ